MRMLGQGNTRHVHAEQTRNQVNRQGYDGEHGQRIQALAIALVDHGCNFFL